MLRPGGGRLLEGSLASLFSRFRSTIGVTWNFLPVCFPRSGLLPDSWTQRKQSFPHRIPRSFSLFLQREEARTSLDLATRKQILHFVQAQTVFFLGSGVFVEQVPPRKGPTVAAALLFLIDVFAKCFCDEGGRRSAGGRAESGLKRAEAG